MHKLVFDLINYLSSVLMHFSFISRQPLNLNPFQFTRPQSIQLILDIFWLLTCNLLFPSSLGFLSTSTCHSLTNTNDDNVMKLAVLRKLMQGDASSPKAPLGNNFRPCQGLNHRVVRTNIDFRKNKVFMPSLYHFIPSFLMPLTKSLSWVASRQ